MMMFYFQSEYPNITAAEFKRGWTHEMPCMVSTSRDEYDEEERKRATKRSRVIRFADLVDEYLYGVEMYKRARILEINTFAELAELVDRVKPKRTGGRYNWRTIKSHFDVIIFGQIAIRQISKLDPADRHADSWVGDLKSHDCIVLDTDVIKSVRRIE